jgi:hypothetical protein
LKCWVLHSSILPNEPKYVKWVLFVKNGVPLVTIAGIFYPHDIIAIPLLSDQGIISEIVQLHRSGHPVALIAKRLKIARSTVRSKLTGAGISFEEPPLLKNPMSKRNSGKPRWNSPYGFMYSKGKLAPHPQEFETLQLILQWSKAGQKYQTIANKLQTRKLRPRSAKHWNRFTIRQIVLWHAERVHVLPEATRRATRTSNLETDSNV